MADVSADGIDPVSGQVPAEPRLSRPEASSVGSTSHNASSRQGEERQPLRLAVLRDEAEIAAIVPQWRALEARTGQASAFFQSSAWCLHVLRSLLRQGESAVDPLVVCAWRGDQLTAVWPMRVARKLGLRILTDLGEPFGQYGGALVESGEDCAATCQAMIAEVVRVGGIDGIRCTKVRLDNPIRSALLAAGARMGACLEAPFVALGDYPSFAAFHQRVKPKTRKNLRNARNRLTRLGTLTHRVFARDDPGLLATIRRSYELRSEWLNENGLSSRAFADPGFRALIEALGAEAGTGIDLLVMALQLDGRDIAIQWGFVYQGTYYAYIAGRDPGHDQSSPGRLHLGYVLETCYAKGITCADLLAPVAPYKMSWATGVVEVCDVTLPLSLRGRLLLDHWELRCRPRAKAAFMRLPLAVRRPLAWLMRRKAAEAEEQA